ncbi:uncharacterized protein V1518DRAFT_412252 [Limtongia smithiae]|uniref:uncharacterized protein n=1 Tax=Limtongia smithiae TaxID=1125753 RepID=UPI0034CD8CAD
MHSNSSTMSSPSHQPTFYDCKGNYMPSFTLSHAPTPSPISSAVSPPMLHHLPPIRPLPQDDILAAAQVAPGIASLSPPHYPLPPMQMRGQDDARQGVEALLSLNHHAAASASMSPEPQHKTNSISSIMNCEYSAAAPPASELYQKRVKHEYEQQCYLPHIADAILAEAAPAAKGAILPSISSEVFDDAARGRGNYWSTASALDKMEKIGTICSPLPQDHGRGTVIAIEGPSDITSEIASSLSKTDEFTLCEVKPEPEEQAPIDPVSKISAEGRALTTAVKVHRMMNDIQASISAKHSVLIPHYVLAYADESTRELLKDAGATTDGKCSQQQTPDDDWIWCANLYRGVILPDIVISVVPKSDMPHPISTIVGGKTKVFFISGAEELEAVQGELRKVIAETSG